MDNSWKVVTFKGNSVSSLSGHTNSFTGKNELLILGGTSSKSPLDDGCAFTNQAYVLNVLTRTISLTKSVGLKSLSLGFHTAETIDSKIYIYGGKTETTILNDMIVFNTGFYFILLLLFIKIFFSILIKII